MRRRRRGRSRQALAILLAFDPAADAAENAERLQEAHGGVRTGGVARAAREDPAERFGVGDAVGYSGEDLRHGASRPRSWRRRCAR